jgi:hypothetical protein
MATLLRTISMNITYTYIWSISGLLGVALLLRLYLVLTKHQSQDRKDIGLVVQVMQIAPGTRNTATNATQTLNITAP